MVGHPSLRLVLWSIALVFGVAAGGCDEHAEDKEEIRANWAQMIAARDNSQGETAVSLVTAQSIATYERLLRLALDGQKKELEQLDALDLCEVLLIRIGGKRKDLEGLTPRQYFVYATNQGWYKSTEPVTIEPGKIRINGDRAFVHFYDGDEKTGETGVFLREDGVWKWDEESWRPGFNTWVRTMAEEEGVTIPEYLISMIEADHGKTAPKNVWMPMK
jgi:hypothetical protein